MYFKKFIFAVVLMASKQLQHRIKTAKGAKDNLCALTITALQHNHYRIGCFAELGFRYSDGQIVRN